MQEIFLTEAVQGMGSATVRAWHKRVGDPVAIGDALVVLEAERCEIEVTAASAGRLAEIAAEPGVTVQVGGLLGRMAQAGEAVSASAKSPAQSASVAPSQPAIGGAVPEGVTPVLMPQAGNTMEEGTVLEWKVAEGDTVTEGQILCEIETDKATMDFESPAAGRVVKIVVPAGGIAAVKTPIALLGGDGVDLSGWEAGTTAPAAAAAPVAAPAASAPSAAPTSTASTVSASAAETLPEGAVTPILMPQAGNSMEEGTVLEWKVSAGDVITEGQILCEIETDKATMDFESPAAGRLARIVVPAGEIAAVKTVIAYLAERDEDVDLYIAQSGAGGASAQAPAQQVASNAPAAGASQKPVSAAAPTAGTASRPSGRVKASPAARKAAAARGLDLSAIGAGSGPDGRLLSSDVAAYRGPVAAPAGAATDAVTRAPMTKMRRAIATNLQRSKQTVPHFYLKQTIDAGALFAFYKEHKPKVGCTLNDVVNLGCARVIGEFPALRTRLEGEELVTYPSVNLGIAVGVDDGLVVPVVMGVDRMDLATLATTSKRLIQGARAGKLENIGHGVFTTTNLGSFGTDEFSAIINPPESGILAIGAVKEAVLVSGGAMRAGRVMTMVLSADHRVVDGVMAAKFMARLKEVLEAPAEHLG
ncbi:MAG: 2-oxo acid dehydrogenase subunit E2 [Verrucomicrobiota bacterium]|nr:2-oxo acid dehydrogenase subunit E2 [Verrucomicrobiota bacterium]